MDETERAEYAHNKSVRGYIMRCLGKGYRNRALIRSISNALIAESLVLSPDITEYLDYLVEGEYIEFLDENVKTINAYSKDVVIKLTKKGIDLLEATIVDAGVDV